MAKILVYELLMEKEHFCLEQIGIDFVVNVFKKIAGVQKHTVRWSEAM